MISTICLIVVVAIAALLVLFAAFVILRELYYSLRIRMMQRRRTK